MKKIITLLLVLTLLSSLVFAGGSNKKEAGDKSSPEPQLLISARAGQPVPVTTGVQNMGKEKNLTLQVQQKKQLIAQKIIAVKLKIEEKKRELNRSLRGLEKPEQKVYKNQNRVREVVHSLLAMEDLTGGIGKNISRIAREFNNSVQATIRAEEKIQKRSNLLRFFWGGEQEAAKEIEQQVKQNQLRIQQIKQLKEQSDCEEEVKAMVQEQIQNIEQEQNRLKQVAQKEKEGKGLFGRLFGWLHW